MTGKADVPAIRTFRANLQSVHELMRFDDKVLEFVIIPLDRLARSQTTAGITNPRHRVDGVLRMVRGIKDNQSLKPHYSAMYNQCLVLLVSYFASAARALFVDAVVAAINSGARDELLDAEIRLTPRDVRDASVSTPTILAEAVADGKEMSFQDMQSVDRAFRRYFSVAPDKGQMVNDIIIGQACRHAIVHTGAQVNRRLIAQVKSAMPRTIKPELVDGTPIEFSRAEVRAVMKEMLKYLRDTASLVESAGIALPRAADA
jgi:hypothetical protein